MRHGSEHIRVPRLRAVVAGLLALVGIGLVVFLRRYRGADRTAIALGLLSAAGLCLIVALAWFQCRFGGRVAPAARLREVGLWAGLLAGVSTAEVCAALLAVRWAIDQQTSPAAEVFAPAFLQALRALATSMASGFPAYLAVGGVVGALAGLGIAEIIIGCAVPASTAAGPGSRSPGAFHSSTSSTRS